MAREIQSRTLHVGKTKYHNVYECLRGTKIIYKTALTRKSQNCKWCAYYNTLDEAAIQVDLKLISLGLEPKNKLKKLNK